LLKRKRKLKKKRREKIFEMIERRERREREVVILVGIMIEIEGAKREAAVEEVVMGRIERRIKVEIRVGREIGREIEEEAVGRKSPIEEVIAEIGGEIEMGEDGMIEREMVREGEREMVIGIEMGKTEEGMEGEREGGKEIEAIREIGEKGVEGLVVDQGREVEREEGIVEEGRVEGEIEIEIREEIKIVDHDLKLMIKKSWKKL
jgi:hypothetical protein